MTKRVSSPDCANGKLEWSAPKSHVSATQPSQEELEDCLEALLCVPSEPPPAIDLTEPSDETGGEQEASQPGLCGSSGEGQDPSPPQPDPRASPAHVSHGKGSPQQSSHSGLEVALKHELHSKEAAAAAEIEDPGDRLQQPVSDGDDDDYARVFALTEQQSQQLQTHPHTPVEDDAGMFALTEQPQQQQQSTPVHGDAHEPQLNRYNRSALDAPAGASTKQFQQLQQQLICPAGNPGSGNAQRAGHNVVRDQRSGTPDAQVAFSAPPTETGHGQGATTVATHDAPYAKQDQPASSGKAASAQRTSLLHRKDRAGAAEGSMAPSGCETQGRSFAQPQQGWFLVSYLGKP